MPPARDSERGFKDSLLVDTLYVEYELVDVRSMSYRFIHLIVPKLHAQVLQISLPGYLVDLYVYSKNILQSSIKIFKDI